MTPDTQKIVDQVILSLGTYNLGDIKESRKLNIPNASFILCGCFIDQLSSYIYKGNDERRFKEFTDNYLSPGFKGMGRMLYSFLRCSLVHNYSTRGRFGLEYGDRTLHLKKYMHEGKEKTYIDLDELIDELQAAFDRYKAEVMTDKALQDLAVYHQKEYPILRQTS